MATKTFKRIKLVSSEKTGHFYVTTKSAKKQEKLELRKYDPVVRKHVLYKEEKMK
jgi:large subunit ribosomal protein L33